MSERTKTPAPFDTLKLWIAEWLAVAGTRKLEGKALWSRCEAGDAHGPSDTDLTLMALIRLSDAIAELLQSHECTCFALDGPDSQCSICGRRLDAEDWVGLGRRDEEEAAGHSGDQDR